MLSKVVTPTYGTTSSVKQKNLPGVTDVYRILSLVTRKIYMDIKAAINTTSMES